MKRWIAVIGIVFVGCAFPQPEPPQDPVPEVGTGSLVVEPEEPLVDETMEPDPYEIDAPPATETGAVLESSLPNGILRIGNDKAKQTLLVFTDFSCRYCKEFAFEHLPRLVDDYVQTGMLKVEIVPFPLQKYEGSANAAKAFLCATAAGKGFRMHQALFSEQHSFQTNLIAYGNDVGMENFEQCVTSQDTQQTLSDLRAWSDAMQVTLVPTLFLNGEKMVGLPYYPDLRGRIEN